MPRVTAVEAKFLEPHEINKLWEAAQGSRYMPLFQFLVHTGLRRGEALALTWDDVDLEERLVRVRGTLARVNGQLKVLEPKSAKSRRTIPLSDPAAGNTAATSSSPTSARPATPGTRSAP